MAVVGVGPGEVVLAGGASASTLFYQVLTAAAAAHPRVFETVELGESAGDFKKRYAEVLPRLEAVRADSDRRGEIAATLARESGFSIAWRTNGEEVPLAGHLEESIEPFPVEAKVLGGTGNLHPRVVVGDTGLAGGELTTFVSGLDERGEASAGVAEAIGWIVDRAGADGIDLRDRRVVVLGASAELAPTRLWLEGGASVLWIDINPPPLDLLETDVLSGTVHWVPGGADLLREPLGIRATIEEFADGGPIDLGLYAYAPGHTREWRLTGAMNAIVDSLPSDMVRTITMLVSPTTCGVLAPADAAGEVRRRDRRPRWQAALDRVGLLGHGPGHARHGETCTNRGIVPIQGASYQAAQYLGKLMAAETWATGDAPRHVSANTAGVSRTVSLRHPVFDTAFAGAKAFGVETYEPDTTAALNGLLSLRDWLDPEAPCSPQIHYDTTKDRALALTSTRVHGGIYELPYPIEPALRVAAAIGVAKDPRRIGPLLKRG